MSLTEPNPPRGLVFPSLLEKASVAANRPSGPWRRAVSRFLLIISPDDCPPLDLLGPCSCPESRSWSGWLFRQDHGRMFSIRQISGGVPDDGTLTFCGRPFSLPRRLPLLREVTFAAKGLRPVSLAFRTPMAGLSTLLMLTLSWARLFG